MSNLEALLLGVVQGLTEFLPISSSGHLIIVPWLQDYTFLTENEAFNKTFDVALHAGTLIAAIAFFRLEVWRLIVSFIAVVRKRAIETSEERLAMAIAIGTIPAVIAGGLASDFIDEHLGEPWMIAVQLILFAALLDWADRRAQRRALGQTACATASGSASPRCSPWRRAPRARGSRSPPAASSASTATPPPASPSSF